MAFRAAVVILLMPSVSSKCLPFNISFIFGNRKKSLGAKFGEWAGCSNTVICLVAKTYSLLLFFGQLLWDHFCTHFPHAKSSVKIFLTVSLSMFTCSAMLLTVSRRFDELLQCFLQFFLLLAVLISLRQ